MRRASAHAGEKAAEKAVAGGGDGDAAAAFAQRVVQAQLRKATTAPSTRKHLHLTGEYQFQDVVLSDVRARVAGARGLLRGAGLADRSCACCPQPFNVNAGMVLNAYMRLSCNTGCRPGMAVNDAVDGSDEAGPWFEVPPLRNRSITISPVGSRTPVDLQGHPATIRMEIVYDRTKGQYFVSYVFGNAITPDSDEMIRLGTVALVRWGWFWLGVVAFRRGR
jgi:hypothetical protein